MVQDTTKTLANARFDVRILETELTSLDAKGLSIGYINDGDFDSLHITPDCHQQLEAMARKNILAKLENAKARLRSLEQ